MDNRTKGIGRLDIHYGANGEKSLDTDIAPMEASIMSRFVHMGKLADRDEMEYELTKISNSEGNSDSNELLTGAYRKLSENEKDAVKDMFEYIVDWETNDVAKLKKEIIFSKLDGLLQVTDTIEPKDERLSESELIGKMRADDLIDFPQFFPEISTKIKNIIPKADMMVDDIIELIVDNPSKRDTLLTMMGMLDVSYELGYIMSKMAQKSKDNSNLDSEEIIRAVEVTKDSIRDTKDEDIENICNMMVGVVGRDGLSRNAENEMFNTLDRVPTREYVTLTDIHQLASNKPLTVENTSIALDAMTIIADNINLDTSRNMDDISDDVAALLPVVYMSLALETKVVDLVDGVKTDNFNFEDADYYKPDDIQCVEDAITIDLDLGVNQTTFYYGVETNNNVYRLLARQVLPTLTKDTIFDYISGKDAYAVDVTVKDIKAYLEEIMVSVKDDEAELSRIASIIYNYFYKED